MSALGRFRSPPFVAAAQIWAAYERYIKNLLDLIHRPLLEVKVRGRQRLRPVSFLK